MVVLCGVGDYICNVPVSYVELLSYVWGKRTHFWNKPYKKKKQSVFILCADQFEEISSVAENE